MVEQINARVDEKLKATAEDLTDRISSAVREASQADALRTLQEGLRSDVSGQTRAVEELSRDMKEVLARIEQELVSKLEPHERAISALQQRVQTLSELTTTQSEQLSSFDEQINLGFSGLVEAHRIASQSVRELSQAVGKVRTRIEVLDSKREKQERILVSLERRVDALAAQTTAQNQQLNSISSRVDQGLSDLAEALRLARGLERRAEMSWWQRLVGWMR